jgi:hypothetical protein
MRQITIAALALLPLVLGGHARADEPKPLKIPTVMTRLVLLERVPCLPQ